MSIKHKHDSCKHRRIEYCNVCSVAYCLKCGKEWREQIWTYAYPYTSYGVENYSDQTVCTHHDVY